MSMLDQTSDWARAVVDGRIVAGELVRCAAERHLRDLVDGPGRGLHWDVAAAEHAIGFFPAALTITGGMKVGQPFHLLPYTLYLTGSLYGWRHRETGQRRFRSCWVETGKGQAKSPWMAAVGLYEMRFAGVARAEVYAIAGTREQANVLFRDAVAMARADVPGTGNTLDEYAGLILRGTGDNCWKIEWDGSAEGLGTCFFRTIAPGESISGPKPRLVLADEVHEHPDDGPIELWTASIQKVPGDPLMILGTNTPGADQIVGCTYGDYYTRVAKGEFNDDAALAFIATTDKNDDPLKDESCWPKSLPALGITFEVDKIREMVRQAAGLPARALTVKRLYFGIRVGTADSWIDQGCWDACLGQVDADALRGLPCWLGMDLSQRNDLTALAAVWRGTDGRLHVKVWSWTPADTLDERTREDKAPYDQWVFEAEKLNSCLTATPGRTISKDFVATQVRDLCAVHDVQAMAFDPAHIKDFMTECDRLAFPVWQYGGPDADSGSGLKMIVHAQGARGLQGETDGKCLWMPRSIERLEDLILSGGITIDASPVTRWCSSNMTLDSDAQGNRFPNKRRSRGRIDNIVAAAMAVGAATAPPMRGGMATADNTFGGFV